MTRCAAGATDRPDNSAAPPRDQPAARACCVPRGTDERAASFDLHRSAHVASHGADGHLGALHNERHLLLHFGHVNGNKRKTFYTE
jgi:hypothetical protein